MTYLSYLFAGYAAVWIGLFVTMASTFSIAEKIAKPVACPIPERK